MADAADLLNRAETCEIIGPDVLFQGSDGKWYTVVVEVEVVEASPEFVKGKLAEREDDQ